MRKQLTGAILVTGTVAAALALGVPAALAVMGGPNFTWVQASGTTFTLRDTTAGNSFTCTVSTGAGTVNKTTLSVTSSTFGSSSTPCTGPLGGRGTIRQKSGTTATISPVIVNNGVAAGTITGVDEILTVTTPISCTIEVTGTEGFTYTNSSTLLQFTTAGENLSVENSTCPGFSRADAVTFNSGSGGAIVTGNPNPVQM